MALFSFRVANHPPPQPHSSCCISQFWILCYREDHNLQQLDAHLNNQVPYCDLPLLTSRAFSSSGCVMKQAAAAVATPAAAAAAAATTCAGCRRPIRDQYIFRVLPDLEWHADCLRCCECQAYLDETCTCFVRHGRVYCKSDYLRYERSIPLSLARTRSSAFFVSLLRFLWPTCTHYSPLCIDILGRQLCPRSSACSADVRPRRTLSP